MMIRFIDLRNGNVFNGEQPYTFWFEEGQSVSFNYVRKICFVSTKYEHTISLDSPVFTLLDISKITEHTGALEILDQQKYYSLEPTDTLPGLKVPADVHSLTLTGTPYNNLYVYMIYILGRSVSSGEFKDVFYIDDTPYNIGADFYNEDERLSINLGNYGMDLPYEVQKAVYDTNVHEELRDNITMNRKYKELLLEYFDILVNKGNYKSLLDSLNWFEYGNLVSMREFWNEKGTPYYYYEELNRIAEDDFMMKVSEMIKKTYIGIYLGLKKLKRSADGKSIEYENHHNYVWHNDNQDIQWATLLQLDGNPAGTAIIQDPYNTDHDRLMRMAYPTEVRDYDDEHPGPGEGAPVHEDLDEGTATDSQQGATFKLMWPEYEGSGEDGSILLLNELNPIIEDIAAKWSQTDLALKMTMVGNFYSTYFMPIHLDLIHSTIEAMVFSVCLKILYHTRLIRWDSQGTFNAMKVDRTTTGYLEPLKDLYVYSDTLFRQPLGNENPWDYVGVEGIRDNRDDDEGKKYIGIHRFGGIGCLVRYCCSFKTMAPVVRELIVITNDLVPFPMIRESQDVYGEFMTPDPETEEQPSWVQDINIDFDILLQMSGNTHINFMFYTADGQTFIHTDELDVQADAGRDISLYRVSKRVNPAVVNLTQQLDGKPKYNLEGICNYMFGQYNTGYNVYPEYMYSQTLAAHDGGVGLNHVVAFKAFDSNIQPYIYYDNTLVEFPGSSSTSVNDIIDVLNEQVPSYRWYVTWEEDDDIQAADQLPEVVTDDEEVIDIEEPETHIVGISKSFMHDGMPLVEIRSGEHPLPHNTTNRYVCESRFVNIMQRFKPTTEYEFDADAVLMLVPSFGENVTYPIYDAVWTLHNISTGETFVSKIDGRYNGDVMTPFAARYDDRLLSSGYYDVMFQYRYSPNTDYVNITHRKLFKIR